MNGIRVSLAPSVRAGLGATVYEGGATFRVWAPHATDVAVVCRLAADEPETILPLAAEPAGLWSADTRVSPQEPSTSFSWVARIPSNATIPTPANSRTRRALPWCARPASTGDRTTTRRRHGTTW